MSSQTPEPNVTYPTRLGNGTFLKPVHKICNLIPLTLPFYRHRKELHKPNQRVLVDEREILGSDLLS